MKRDPVAAGIPDPANVGSSSSLGAPGPLRRLPPTPDIGLVPGFHLGANGNDRQRNGVAVNWRNARVTLDYQLEREDGLTTVTLANRPELGNFAHVYLVVEETAGPAYPERRIRTAFDVSMVGLEYFLPKEYFEYRDECERRLRELLTGMGRRAVDSGIALPAPDPTAPRSLEDYVTRVRREFPELVPLKPAFTRAEAPKTRLGTKAVRTVR